MPFLLALLFLLPSAAFPPVFRGYTWACNCGAGCLKRNRKENTGGSASLAVFFHLFLTLKPFCQVLACSRDVGWKVEECLFALHCCLTPFLFAVQTISFQRWFFEW